MPRRRQTSTSRTHGALTGFETAPQRPSPARQVQKAIVSFISEEKELVSAANLSILAELCYH